MPPADFTWLYLGVFAKAQLEINTHTHTQNRNTYGYITKRSWKKAIPCPDSRDQDAPKLNYWEFQQSGYAILFSASVVKPTTDISYKNIPSLTPASINDVSQCSRYLWKHHYTFYSLKECGWMHEPYERRWGRWSTVATSKGNSQKKEKLHIHFKRVSIFYLIILISLEGTLINT